MTRMLPTTSTTIGAEPVTVDILVPRPEVRFAERVAISWSGLVDRLRHRHVDDDARTHYLHMLQHHVGVMDAELVARVEGGISRIEVELAAASAVAGRVRPAQLPEPDESALGASEGRARLQWAARLRETRAENATAGATGTRAAAARVDHDVLLAARTALLVEGEAQRRRWREAFSTRAARYNRSRFGLGGRRPSTQPGVVGYEPVEAAVLARPSDPRTLGGADNPVTASRPVEQSAAPVTDAESARSVASA